MPRTDESYRGYRIAYLKDDHHAWVWAPGEALAMINVQQRSEGETLDDLRHKAQAMNDADIDRHAVK